MILYLLHIIYVLFYRDFFVYISMPRDDICRIQQRCFIYRSVFAIPALRKRRVQGHCAAYHFRMFIIKCLCTNCGYELLVIRCRGHELHVNPAYHRWSVDNFRFFLISQKPYPLQICIYRPLERSFYEASARVCCIKIHAKMTEILVVKDWSFYIHGCPSFLTAFSNSFFKYGFI